MVDSLSLTPDLEKILQSKKYRQLNIPSDTILDLIRQPEAKRLASRDLQKWVKRKLHNIVADYLGDPDYEKSTLEMDEVFQSGDEIARRDFCRKILSSHASTRERLPILSEFYAGIFELTGIPKSILDLACGLNPFALPWMGLPISTHYYAFDLHQPRIDLINQFFSKVGLNPLAQHQDILARPPTIAADVAFLFKEAHRMEQRQPGCNRDLWKALNVKWLLVSLPTSSLSGKHDLLQKHRRLVQQSILGNDWKVTEILFGNEMVFCIKKSTQHTEDPNDS